MNRKNIFSFAIRLLCLFALATTLLTVIPQTTAHAQDCLECIGGGDPPPLPPDPPIPDIPPGGGDGPDQPDDPNEPTEHPEPPCSPYFDPPTIDAGSTLDPSYPITLGQDPDDRGVDVSGISAHGGAHHCPDGGQARIVSFSVTKVQLAQSSITWINGELARKYPGAHVKGSYPLMPSFQVSGLGTSQAQLFFHLAPLDPGYYEVSIQAIQEDGQPATAILRVPVYLMESTIIQ